MTDQEYNAKIEEQWRYIEELKLLVSERSTLLGRPLVSSVVTFGCQMNARDSEKLRGILDAAGFRDTENEDEADLVIYNTCTVRDNADQHVYGRLGHLNAVRKKRPSMIIGLCGCMMQEDHVVAKIKKSYPFVNLMFGTHNLYAFPELLVRTLSEDKRVIDIRQETKIFPESLPVRRKHFFKSGVNIMYGCNNFCSYCIVPYVRGREISRAPEEILDEVRRLVADGCVEIMLLGQNVNSYGKTLPEKTSFAELLREVCKIEGLQRLRFMTSHPKDLSDELIEVMAENPIICPHMHLPVQSGSDEILKKMNRHYDRAKYLDTVRKLREAIPDISFTTDIIVGFPGETEEDFEDTLSLIREVGFDSAFTFIYSKRKGTPAAEMENQVPEEVVKRRFKRLLDEVKVTAEERCARFTGRIMDVLIEEENREPGLVTGRIGHNIVVHLPGDASMIGKIIPVHLKECKGFYYFGEPVRE
ncbi:MAG: tRNA (N6-isopentenyl adenosine(37)-C2)-methylthiotransferase MiaB [Lachnospiraceae bacterium]|jgi:tRNA-2-methylthio-N6-dimethylallyladenosine synthase|nr:tRNA (N6-isopentenyl adenosine(37)-C2)-methylthiotransferase MiaB [Lachnospiraceae bacterium]